MAFKLYGSPSSSSTYTRVVAMIAKERNIPYEFIPVDLKKGENKQPAHLEHHPFGQVPYITVRRLSQSLLPQRRSVFVHCLLPPGRVAR
jgi:glutathione S-transferase